MVNCESLINLLGVKNLEMNLSPVAMDPNGPQAFNYEALLHGILLLVSTNAPILLENVNTRIEAHLCQSHFSILQDGPSTASTSTL